MVKNGDGFETIREACSFFDLPRYGYNCQPGVPKHSPYKEGQQLEFSIIMVKTRNEVGYPQNTQSLVKSCNWFA